MLRCDPGGQLGYRRAAGYLMPGETLDAAAGLAVPGSAGSPVALLHSTSWRHRGDGTIVLAYAGLPDPEPGRAALPIRLSRQPRAATRGDHPPGGSAMSRWPRTRPGISRSWPAPTRSCGSPSASPLG